MGQAELIDRILTDARAKAAAIDGQRAREVRAIETRTAAAAEEIQQHWRERRERQAAVIRERAKSSARQARRNAELAGKWQVVHESARLARQAVLADPDYPKMIADLVKRYVGNDGQASLSAEDTQRFGAMLPIKLAKPAQIDGGVIIRRGKVELNFSLSETIAVITQQLSAELLRVLFSGTG